MKPRFAAPYLAFAFAVFLATAFAVPVHEVPINSLSYTVTHLSSVYRWEDDTTWFTYRVTTGSEPLGELWLLTCSTPGTLVAGQLWRIGTYEAAGRTGIQYLLGQDANTQEIYVIKFHGNVRANSAGSYLIQTSESLVYGIGSPLVVPDCTGDDIKTDCSPPPDQTVECDSPEAATPRALASTIELVNQTRTDGQCPYDYIISRIYRVASGGNNAFSECVQRITVHDTTPPTPNALDTFIRISCNESIPPIPEVNFTDNCDPNPSVNFCEERKNGTCPDDFFIIRTWTATDICGNSRCVTQTIARIDDQPPTLLNVPEDLELQCGPSLSIPPPADVRADDHGCDCFLFGGVRFSEERYPGSCNGTFEILRTWNVTDCCGNFAEATQLISVVDNVPPTLNRPINGTFPCDAIGDPLPLTGSDDCSGLVTTNVTRARFNFSSCPAIFLLHDIYTGCDACGNPATVTAFISVTNPYIAVFNRSTLPPNITVQCGHVPSAADVTASHPCLPVSISLTERRVNGSCPSLYTLFRTWTAVDLCNGTVSYTQRIDVIDTLPPRLDNSSIPNLGPYQCGFEVPSLESTLSGIRTLPHPNRTGDCPELLNITARETRVNGSCINDFVLIREYTVTSCIGLSDTISRRIVVKDTTPPLLHGVPGNITVDCLHIPDAPLVQSSDNCDCPVVAATIPNCLPVIVTNRTITGSCPGEFIIVRTWTTVDSCGNRASADQYITVTNPFGPAFDRFPEDVDVSCESIPPPESLSGNSSCSLATVTVLDDVRLNGSCPNEYTLLRTYVISDQCGHSLNRTQRIRVHDNTPPVFGNTVSDVNGTCLELPPIPDVCATDNCPGLNMSFLQVVEQGPCVNNLIFIIVRTWTITDACGNTASQTQRVFIFNVAPPAITPGTNTTQECDVPVNFVPPIATSQCLNLSVTNVSSVAPGDCPFNFVASLSFLAIDQCGNPAISTSTVHVVDTKPPAFTSFPEDIVNATCTPPLPGLPTAVDNCDPEPSVTGPSEEFRNGSCPYVGLLLRTWTACDSCGNCVNRTQRISLIFTTPPHFTSPLPNDTTAECVPPPSVSLTAVDACGNPVPVILQETNSSTRCPFTITRLYRAVDVCGLVVTHVQTVTVNDVIPPTLSDSLVETTNECVPPLPPAVCGQDNCPGLNISFTETRSNQQCPNSYDLTRLWIVRDSCGNLASATQLIHVRDTTPPVFTRPALNRTFECLLGDIVPPNATDNCGGPVRIVESRNIRDRRGACFILDISWLATDECGNHAWLNETYTIQENSLPQIQWTPAPPENVTVTCARVPDFPTPHASGGCSANFTRLQDLVDNGPCPYIFTLTRRIVVADLCLNTFTISQVIQGVHTIGPTLSQLPPNQTLPCTETALLPNITALDSCGVSLPVSLNRRFEQGSCAGEFLEIRVWSAVDQCGLTVSHTQVIQYFNHFPPNVEGLNPIDLENSCIPPLSTPPNASGFCNASVTIHVTNESLLTSCPLDTSAAITYVVTDECGNTATVTQRITSTTHGPPTLHNTPPDVTASCEDVPSAVTVTATDVCGNLLNVSFTERRINGSCPNEYNLSRTWTAIDSCGRAVSYTQIVIVSDHTRPTLTGVPANTRALCGFVPCPANVSASDNCPGLRIDFFEIVHEGANCCDFILERCWAATDACGNSVTACHNITVFYNIPPILEIPPNPPCIPCENFTGLPPANASAFEPPLALGFCLDQTISADPTCGISTPTQSSFTFTSGGSSHTLTFISSSTLIVYADGEATLSATLSEAGSSDTWTLSLLLSGATTLASLPGYSPPQELNPSCYDPLGTDPTKVDINNWDYYTGLKGTLAGGGETLALNAVSGEPSQVGVGANGRNREYGATLLTTIAGQSVPIHLDVRPEGADCVFDHTQFPQLDCNVSIPINITVERFNGTCPQEFFFRRTFCITDPFNPATVICETQVISVCDFEGPRLIGNLTSLTFECDQEIPPARATVVDNCDEHPLLDIVETRENGSCPGNYTLHRVYTFSDHCGHTGSAVSTVVVHDTTPPVLIGVPTTRARFFCNESALPPINATDNCGIDYRLWPRITRQQLPLNESGFPICPQNYIARYTVVAEDLCGNRVTAQFDRLVVNDQPPVLINIPADFTLNCTDDLPRFNVRASSVCEGDLTSRVKVSRQTLQGTCSESVIVITWNVTDSCGQTASASTRVTIQNPFPPSFTSELPGNITVPCENVPEPPTLTGTHPCTGVNITFHEQRVDGSCPNSYQLFRTWTLSDCKGNTKSHTQIVTVVDTQAPTITQLTPALIEASCRDIPLPPDVCASDNCPGLSITFEQTRTSLSDLPQCDRYLLNRTWLARDACGNTASTTQAIRVFDNVPPVCTPPDAPSIVRCNETRIPARPNCTDDCSDVTIRLFTRLLPGPQNCSLSEIREFSYLASDACGNFVWVNTTVTVIIDQPPALQVPNSTTIECAAPPPIFGTATDPCFGDLPAIPTVVFTNGSCPNLGTQTVTFVVANPCGLTSEPAVVTVNIVDTIPPVFDNPLPANLTVQCHQVPPADRVTATDNCGAVTVTFDEFNTSGSCPNSYTIVRTWVASDCVGHTITHIQHITVIDTTPPVLQFGSLLLDANVSCTDVPPPPAACGSDNCPGLSITFRQQRNNLSSNPLCARYQLNRTWLLTDACGNTDDAHQLITVFDTTPPSCGPAPPSKVVDCANQSLETFAPDCSDDCSGVVVETFHTTLPGSCPANSVRNFAWRVSDNCGNFVWLNYSVTVRDTHPPTFSDTPPDATVPCDNIPAPIAPRVSDDCSQFNLSFHESNTSNPNACQNYTITRVWIATDACGNSASFVQTLHVIQTLPPTFNQPLPGNQSLECTENFTIPVLTANDICGPATVTSRSTPVSDDGCTRVTRIEWTATNLCGLTATHIIYVTVTDVRPPVLTAGLGFSSFVTEQCNETHTPPPVCCNDNCPGVSLSFNQTLLPGSCPSRFRLVRRWTCTDVCGNFATLDQTVNVVDTFPPVFDSIPPNEEFECHDLSTPPVVTAHDACSAVQVNLTEFRVNGSCSASFQIVRRYVATDECGLQASFEQTVTVNQTTPPFTNETTPLCFTSDTERDYLVIRNLTEPNNFFPAGDLCTPIHIVFDSCTSDLDVDLGNGCFYNSTTDELFVSARVGLHPLGRLYTVNATIINECGLSTPTSRQIFIPFNRSSITLRGLPFSPEECVPIRPTCPQNCACQTVNHYCNEGEETGTLRLLSTHVDTSAATTTFSYALSSGAVPNRVLLGIDLTRYEIVSVFPDANVTLGQQTGTYIKGVAWNDARTFASVFNITIKGILSDAELSPVPYLLGGLVPSQDSPPDSCSDVLTVQGPGRSSVASLRYGSSAVYTGRVRVVGNRFGIDRTADIGIHDAAVALYDSLGRLVRVTLTDLSGDYSFHDVSSSNGLTLALLQDGILRPALRSSGNFLRTTEYDILGINPITGTAHNLTSPNFDLLIDSTQDPLYNRLMPFNTFEGNAKTLNWWRFQYSGLGELDDDLTEAQLTLWATQAATYLSCSASLTSSDPLEANLAAAALNQASGRGFFEPYDLVQQWYLAEAAHVFCDNISDAQDRALALRYVTSINTAGDQPATLPDLPF